MKSLLENNENKEENIIKTLAFFDIFNFPLKHNELVDYILYSDISSKSLNNLINKSPKIDECNRYVFLKDRKFIIQERDACEDKAQKLIKKAQKYSRYLQMVPFVRSVCVCNNLSFLYAEDSSDIDLFIITEKNKLFTARILTTVLLHMLGVRRYKNKIKGRFCLSFFISKENMEMEKMLIEDDIYFIYWMRMLKPMIGQKTYKEFLNKNKWINSYFHKPFYEDQFVQRHLVKYENIQKFFEKILNGKLGNFIEKHLLKWQIKRSKMKAEKLKDKEGTIISKTVLKFHDVERRPLFKKTWKNNVYTFLR